MLADARLDADGKKKCLPGTFAFENVLICFVCVCGLGGRGGLRGIFVRGKEKDCLTDRETDITGKRTPDRQKDRQKQTNTLTKTQAKWIDIHIYSTYKQTDRHGRTEKKRQTDITPRKKNLMLERQTDRPTDKQTLITGKPKLDRHRETDRKTERLDRRGNFIREI